MEEGNLYDHQEEEEHSSSESSIQSWITWFCTLPGHDYYLEVPEEFMEDSFNLTGLATMVPYYSQALETILDLDYDSDQEEEQDNSSSNSSSNDSIELNTNDDDFWKEDDDPDVIKSSQKRLKDARMIEPYAFMLYGLIHQRYLLTRNGLRIMAQRYSNGQFGTCPRYYCYRTPVIPVGKYDETGRESVHLYCPRCLDVYSPPDTHYQNVDGAHFGSTFSHLLFLTYPELVTSPNSHIYQPSIFGFKVNTRSMSGPRNQWLRQRPAEYTIEDETESEGDEEEEDEEEDDVAYPITIDDLVYQTRDLQF